MEQIYCGNKQLISLLGGQKKIGENNHLSMYVLQSKVNDGWLFFHTLTRKLLYLSQSEKENIPSDEKNTIQDFLFDNWFLVDESIDEQKLYEEISCIFKPKREREFKGFSIYVIFTTTTCNANCFYCFERNTRPITMSGDTALKVVDYICKSRNKNEKVSLHWFGGEPMCNYKVIDTICKEMRQRKIPFSSRFTSNVSLFTEALVKRAVNEWRTESVQVTLDGTEDIHNIRKAYSNKKYNYDQTLHNIDLLESSGVNVTIRLNCDENNIDDMEVLVDQLVIKYKEKKRIFLDPHPLFNCDENEKISESTESFYRRMILLEKKTHAYNLSNNEQVIQQSNNAIERIRTGSCQSVSMRIAPDGKLYPCQHIDQVSSYGNIWEGITDISEFEEWKSEQHAMKCKKCKFRPLCASMEKCNAIRSNCYSYANLKYQDWIKDIFLETVDEQKILKCDIEYTVNRLLGDYVIVSDSSDEVLRLNQSAFYMFKKIVQGTTKSKLCEDLRQEYGINKNIAELAVKKFVNRLIEVNYI